MAKMVFVSKVLKLILRSLAKNCFIPKLRIKFLRWSGIVIGEETFVNMNVSFIDNYRGSAIKIGKRVAIAPGAVFIADSDPNNSKLNKIKKYYIRGSVSIADDAWIGANTIILPNVNIGKCSIVGSGAVVTKNVNDYEIVAGNPAKKIGKVDFSKIE